MDCFKFIFLFQLLSLFKILNSLINVDIVEGLKEYFIEGENFETFKFTAIDDGYYLFTFKTWAMIKEATGQIHQDIDLRNQEFITMVYAQKFVKGDYVKLFYPSNKNLLSDFYTIKIEKLDNNINLRLLAGPNAFSRSHHFETVFFDSCEKPIYLLLENDGSSKPLYFKTIIHSGAFTAKYKTTDYIAQENEYINDNLAKLNLNRIAQLPEQFHRNIVELKCLVPGVITVLHTPLNKDYIYQSNNGVIHNIFEDDYHIICSIYAGDSYVQMFNIYGCSTISIGTFIETYDCKDFSSIFGFSSSNFKLGADLKNVQSPYLLLTIVHSENENDGKKLLIEKEEYIINSGERMVIPIEIGNKKKNIKIKSTLPKFYWSLEFSLENDVNYVAFPYSDKLKYESSNILYIRNPYSYENIETDYYWFIVLYHYNEGSTPKFSYEYTDEYKEEENKKKEEEKNKDDNNDNNQPSSTNEEKKLSENPFFWTTLILVIFIISFFIYLKCFKKNEISIEKIVKERELNQINSD